MQEIEARDKEGPRGPPLEKSRGAPVRRGRDSRGSLEERGKFREAQWKRLSQVQSCGHVEQASPSPRWPHTQVGRSS